MEKIALLNLKGEKLKDINLDKEIFGIETNDKVLYDAIILTRASLRQGTHKTKNRSEVSGGGRKPWRQKGTGHARQGSIRATQWVGGGVPFGPRPRDYSIKMNRKERRLALLSALTTKAKDIVFFILFSFIY
jgi:large subunit ribosomal protein L4